ncbi:MAG: sulfatase-like hydrolase/transferase [Hungatella sp.]
MNRPNVIFFFTDQQRWDTAGCYGQPLNVTPHLDALAKEGVVFEEAYTAQPVCGPCRAIFQTGKYATELGCYRNGISLPDNVKTLADYFYEADYETAYVGKWHLASDSNIPGRLDVNYETKAIPPERRGGYRGFWRAADVLEFTSHGYDGYVYNEQMEKCEFHGYRADCITDFALEFLDNYQKEKPFFMTISHIEPHHQNDRNHYEGPNGSKRKFSDFVLPVDLERLGGNAAEEYPDYLGCCHSLDQNLGRLVEKLKDKGLYENTVIVYSSDHGSHFRTRNQDSHKNGYDDYKRSCHSACLHVPLVMAGPGIPHGKRISALVSTASLPKTFLSLAGVKVGEHMIGEDLVKLLVGDQSEHRDMVFAQISESRVGRCIRTPKFLYSVYAPGKNGNDFSDSDVYREDFLYDLQKDPYELDNCIERPEYQEVKKELAAELNAELVRAGEKEARIL